jgi:hypothetical protein
MRTVTGIELETILKEKKKESPATLIPDQQKIEHGWLEHLYASHPFERLQIYVSQHAKALLTIIENERSSDNCQNQPTIISLSA